MRKGDGAGFSTGNARSLALSDCSRRHCFAPALAHPSKGCTNGSKVPSDLRSLQLVFSEIKLSLTY